MYRYRLHIICVNMTCVLDAPLGENMRIWSNSNMLASSYETADSGNGYTLGPVFWVGAPAWIVTQVQFLLLNISYYRILPGYFILLELALVIKVPVKVQFYLFRLLVDSLLQFYQNKVSETLMFRTQVYINKLCITKLWFRRVQIENPALKH